MLAILLAACIAPCARPGVTRELRPRIFCNFSSRDARIDPARLRMTINGKDVTAAARVTPFRVTYVPPRPLAPGVYRVVVEVVDMKGRRGVKKWSFTVDPEAPDVEGPRVLFVAPTPVDGAFLGADRLPVAIAIEVDDGKGSGVDRRAVHVALRSSTAGFRSLSGRGAWRGNRFECGLGRLDPGRYVLRAWAADRAGNRSRIVYGSFTVITAPPRIVRIRVRPNPARRGAPVHVAVEVRCVPMPVPRLVRVVLRSAAGELQRTSVRPFDNLVYLQLALEDRAGKPLPAGRYRAEITVVDHGGNRAVRSVDFAVMDVRPPVERSPMFLSIDRVRPLVADSFLEITGRTRPGAEVTIRVNSHFAGSFPADGRGNFRFARIRLEEGANRIEATARDASTGETATARASHRVRLDSTAPRITSVEPRGTTTETAPTIRIAFEESGSGLASHTLRLDGANVSRSASLAPRILEYRASGLTAGAHTVEVTLTDRAGNRATHRYSFTVASEPPPLGTPTGRSGSGG